MCRIFHTDFRHTSLKQAAPILAATWYTSATPLRPEMYCFLASIREEPIKLLDAADGKVRNRFSRARED